MKQLDHCVCVKNRVYEKVCEDAVGKAWDGYGGFRVIIMTRADSNDEYRILASLQKNKIEKVG